jgi:putative tryptophan/tyrosine transport system substrate-binding protein
MNRRKFITLIGGAVGWPIATGAQQPEQVRRLGLLMNVAAKDRVGQERIAAFLQTLAQHGWFDGRNLRIDTRWTDGNPDQIRKHALELAGLAPDVILAPGTAVIGPLLQATRAVPVVFVHVTDPVGGGFVDSLARPGGNATGFALHEYATSGKWLELIKQVAPSVRRVAVVRDPALASGAAQWGVIQAMAPAVGLDVVPVNMRATTDIERSMADFARGSNGGLIVTASTLAVVHRDLIIASAARYRLPSVYYERFFVDAGGLMAYGPDLIDQYRGAAGYVHRILKGEKPADLPVQAPTKYELVINLKTAKALELDVPQSLLARADEVIE